MEKRLAQIIFLVIFAILAAIRLFEQEVHFMGTIHVASICASLIIMLFSTMEQIEKKIGSYLKDSPPECIKSIEHLIILAFIVSFFFIILEACYNFIPITISEFFSIIALAVALSDDFLSYVLARKILKDQFY